MKNKYILKLACIAAMAVLTVSVLVVSSYAWFTMSSSPTVNGIAIAISGSDTILFAPDVVSTDLSGNILHYPGAFSDTLDFSQFSGYSYLNDLGGLTPVSTADGIHWFLPTYYTDTADLSKSGAIQQIDDFLLDDSLSLANLSEEGTYVYLDFWVMAPADGYDLRISTGTGTDGSYVLVMPQVESDGNGSYQLVEGDAAGAASVRIGFLVSEDGASDAAVLAYADSEDADERITTLRGAYTEPGAETVFTGAESFSIYEPNGDWHDPEAQSYVLTASGLKKATYENGTYVKTYSIAWDAGILSFLDMTSITTVQKTNIWVTLDEDLYLNQAFRTYIAGKDLSAFTGESLLQGFEEEYLQGLYDVYVQNGDFIKSSSALSNAADQSGVVAADAFQTLTTAGATEDVTIVHLEKGVAQRIRMFIWIEGQDVDCVNHEDIWNLLVRLEFAGGD